MRKEAYLSTGRCNSNTDVQFDSNLRKLIGKVQLQAFFALLNHTAECIHALQRSNDG